ncbi:helix-turn-helix transcriptional regulator [Vibrio sp. 10N.222.55.A1]|uniref:helix-turn-helix transcriptional regulator n=1 Tax=Vibrio sp. 10N.222.55.A1 TaxID=3229646 RepID=UPI003551D5CE
MKKKPFDPSRRHTAGGVPQIVKKKQLAQELGCSERQIYRMVEDGRLPQPLKTRQGRNGGWFRPAIDRVIKEAISPKSSSNVTS